jgi:hypothetical protein
MSAQSAQRFITLLVSGQAGAQLCHRKPLQVPLGRVGGALHRNLDAAGAVDRDDFGGRPDDRDLEINIVRLARCVISHGNPVSSRANHAAIMVDYISYSRGQFFQPYPAAKRRGPGRGAHPNPVLRQRIQVDQPLHRQAASLWSRFIFLDHTPTPLPSPRIAPDQLVVLSDRNGADIMLKHQFREFGDRCVRTDAVNALVHCVSDFHGSVRTPRAIVVEAPDVVSDVTQPPPPAKNGSPNKVRPCCNCRSRCYRQLYDGRSFKNDIRDIKLDLKTLNEAVSNQKLIEHRIMQLEKWYDEMRHGRGFIQPRGIDGEYGPEGRR